MKWRGKKDEMPGEDVFDVIERIERSQREIAPGIRPARLPFLDALTEDKRKKIDTDPSKKSSSAAQSAVIQTEAGRKAPLNTFTDETKSADHDTDKPATSDTSEYGIIRPDVDIEADKTRLSVPYDENQDDVPLSGSEAKLHLFDDEQETAPLNAELDRDEELAGLLEKDGEKQNESPAGGRVIPDILLPAKPAIRPFRLNLSDSAASPVSEDTAVPPAAVSEPSGDQRRPDIETESTDDAVPDMLLDGQSDEEATDQEESDTADIKDNEEEAEKSDTARVRRRHCAPLRYETFAEALAYTRRTLPLAHEIQLDSQSVQHVWLMTQLKRADTPDKLHELAFRLNYKDLGILFPTLATLSKRGQTEQVQALIRLRASTYLYYHGWTTLQIAYPRAFVAKALSDLCIQLEDRLYALSDIIPARQGRRKRPDLGEGRVVWSDVPLISEIALPSSRHFISDVARAVLDADVPTETFFTNYAISPNLPLGQAVLDRMQEIAAGSVPESSSSTRSFFERYLR
jgi:hypothetical protein